MIKIINFVTVDSLSLPTEIKLQGKKFKEFKVALHAWLKNLSKVQKTSRSVLWGLKPRGATDWF